ncbi:MAG: FUSC family protein [Gammaproteobacteria bacterium]
MYTHFKKAVARISLKRIIEVCIVGYFSFWLGSQYNLLFLSTYAETGGLWAAISGLFIIHELKSDIIGTGSRRLLGTVIGAAVGASVFSFLDSSLLTMTLALAITIIICQLLNLPNIIKIACITVAVMLFVQEIHNVNPWMNAFLRASETLIGGAIAVLIAYLMRHEPDER